jgi:hypothetical protein
MKAKQKVPGRTHKAYFPTAGFQSYKSCVANVHFDNINLKPSTKIQRSSWTNTLNSHSVCLSSNSGPIKFGLLATINMLQDAIRAPGHPGD